MKQPVLVSRDGKLVRSSDTPEGWLDGVKNEVVSGGLIPDSFEHPGTGVARFECVMKMCYDLPP